MIQGQRGLCLGLGSLLLIACAEADGGDLSLDVGVTGAALGACEEMVPATRYIDGIPSYAQCPASESSAIFSNNGIDTATTSQGAGWVRTQYSGGYQCTELAHRYLYFKWNVKWIPNGNAGKWCDTMPPANSGVVQTMTPAHGDIMVLAGGSCGAAASTGHVTVVDVVDPATSRLTVLEQNGARRGMYMQSCAKCFLHVVANDGTSPGAPIGPGPGDLPPTAGSVAVGAGSAAPPAQRPAPAGTAAPTPPPNPGARIPAPAAGSAAPIPTFPAAAGASATAGAPVSPVVTLSPRARTREEAGCGVHGGVGREQSSAGFAMLLGVLVGARSRRRTRSVS